VSLAAGRQAFSRLSAASYSSAAMRALLDNQGLGSAEPSRLELVASQQQAQYLAGPHSSSSPMRQGGQGRALSEPVSEFEHYFKDIYSSGSSGAAPSGHGRDVAEMVRTMGVLNENDQEHAALAALELEPDFDPLSGATATAINRTSKFMESNNRTVDASGSGVGASHNAAATYAAHFGHGLTAYGASGMTVLEELVDAAFRASDRAVAAGARVAHGAALLAAPVAKINASARDGDSSDGRTVFAASAVESSSDPALSVSAERACVLKAVSEGRVEVEALVIASAHGDAFPVPDGSGRQFLAEYGELSVCSVLYEIRQLFWITTSVSFGSTFSVTISFILIF